MVILKNLRKVPYLTMLIITLSYAHCSLASSSKADLLMKGLYKHDKNADFTDDSEGKEKADAFKKSYEEMQKRKKAVEDRREEVEVMREAINISNERRRREGDTDVSPQVAARIVKQHGVPQSEAYKMIDANDPRARKIFDQMVKESVAVDMQKARQIVRGRKNQNNNQEH